MAQVDGEVKLGVSIDTSNVKQNADKLAKSIQNVFSNYSRDSKSANANLMSLQHQMAKYSNDLNRAYEKQKQLASQKMPTQQYLDTEKALAQSTAQANKLSVALEQMRSRAIAEGKDVKDIKNFTQLEEQYKKVNEEAKKYEATLNRLKTTGTGYTKGVDTAEYAKATSDVQRLQNKLAELNTRYNQVGNTSKRSGKELLESFKSPFKHLGNLISRLRQLKNQSKDAFGDMAKSAKVGFMRVLKYAFGIRSIFILFKRLKAATKDAFTAMSASVPRVRDEMASLSASFGQVKNSLATAFQPIFSYVVPALNALASALVMAMNALANFFATFTGQKVIYKATKANNNLAKSYGGAGGAAKDAAEDIAEYDKLIVLNQDNAGGGGGGGGSADPNAGLFEEVPTEPSKLAEMIKEAWKDADFTEVGALIGSKLVDAMEGIDWDKYKKTGKKIGKSVATFLNGVFETPNLFKDVGKTIAEALNTAIGTLGAFSSNFHWDSLGQGMADSVNSFFRTFDFPQLAQTIHDTIVGVLTTVGTFFRETDFKEIGNKLGNFINELDIPTIMSTLGQTIHDAVKGALELAIGFFGSVDFKELGKSIGEFINKIDVKDLLLDLGELVLNIIKALGDAIIGLGKENPLAAAIITLLIGIKVAGKLDKLATSITGGLGSAITSSTGGSVIGSAIADKIKTYFTQEITAATFTSSALNLVGVLGSAITAALIGYKLGNVIYAVWQPEIDKAMEWMMGDIREWTPEELANTSANDVRAQMIGKYEKYDFGYTELNEYADLVAGKYQEALDKGATTQQAYAYALITTQDELVKLSGDTEWAKSETEGYRSTYNKFVNSFESGNKQVSKSSTKTTKAITKDVISQSVSYKKGETSVASLSNTAKTEFANIDKYAKQYIQFQQGETNISSLDSKSKQAFTAINQYLASTGMSVEEFARIYGYSTERVNTNTKNTQSTVDTSLKGVNSSFIHSQASISGSVVDINKVVTSQFTQANTNATNQTNTLKNNVNNNLTATANNSRTPLQNFLNNVNTYTNNANTQGNNNTNSLKTNVNNNLTTMANNSKTPLNTFLNNVSTYTNNANTTATKNTSTIATNIVSAMSNIASGSRNKLSAFVDEVRSHMNSADGQVAAHNWYGVGQNLSAGLGNGIDNSWSGNVLNVVKRLAQNLTNKLKSVFGVHSPSREWAEIGMYLDLGLAEGIEDTETKVIRTIANLGTNINDTLQGSMATQLQLPDIVQGKVIPSGMNYNIQASRQSQEDTDIRSMIREELANISMPERIAVEFPDGRVIAETVWDEEKKMYKQLGYSPRLA